MARGKGRGEFPRERIFEKGASALTNAELLSILTNHGSPDDQAVSHARMLLQNAPGLSGLAEAQPARLRTLGVGRPAQARLLATVEIGRRMLAPKPPRMPAYSLDSLAEYLRLRYDRRDQEVVGVIYLNCRYQYVGEADLFRGSIDRAVVEPRPILRGALDHMATGIILFHTHPSGDPSPSQEDLLFTRRIHEAGQVVGVTLVDHLIIGSGGQWLSLKKVRRW